MHTCSYTYIILSPSLSHRHMDMYPLTYTFIQRHIQIHFFNSYPYTHTDTYLIYIYIPHLNTHTCTYYPFIHILTQPHSKISSHPCVNSSTFIHNPLNHTLTPTCTYIPLRHIHMLMQCINTSLIYLHTHTYIYVVFTHAVTYMYI